MRPALVLSIALAVPCAALAQDHFEIQVYDASVNEPGHFGLEMHLNYAPIGVPAVDDTAGTDHVLHGTLEPSIGITPFFELGGYFLTIAEPGHPYSWAGDKLRAKFKFPSAGDWNFAVNFELGYSPPRYDSKWAGEIRPIFEYRAHRFRVDLNPILSFDFSDPSGAVPHLEPCIAGNYEVAATASVGVEYFAALGAVSAILPVAAEYHALFAVADFQLPRPAGFPQVNIHVGVGHGFTAVSSALILSSILGFDF